MFWFVVSVTDEKSIKSIETFWEENRFKIQRYNIPCALIVNKMDLVDENDPVLHRVNKWSKEQKFKAFFHVSANDNATLKQLDDFLHQFEIFQNSCASRPHRGGPSK